MLRKTLHLTTTMLSRTRNYRSFADHIRLLLLHHRLCDAISIAATIVSIAEDPQTTTLHARAALIHARRSIGSSDFVAAALYCWTFGVGTKISVLSRQVQLLYSFLRKWEPSRLDNKLRSFAYSKMRSWDDLDTIAVPRVRQRLVPSRRPSWIAACAYSEGSIASQRRFRMPQSPQGGTTKKYTPSDLFQPPLTGIRWNKRQMQSHLSLQRMLVTLVETSG